MTKYNELTSRAARNPQPLLTTVDAITSAAALVSDLPTPVFTPSTLANLEEVFSYNHIIPSSVAATSEASFATLPYNNNNNFITVQPQMAAESDYSDDDNSRGSDYLPPSVKRVKATSSYATSSRSASPDINDSQPMRRRRPMHADDANLCPEDYARVVQRRERNKQAAARCRQRRVDLIEQLQEECNSLEGANANLEQSIEQLRQQKEQLEFILQAHQPTCDMTNGGGHSVLKSQPRVVLNNKLPPATVAKSFANVKATDSNNNAHIARPTSLSLARPAKTDALPLVTPGTIAAVTGIPITTPSSLLPTGLSFDLLLDEQSGLTPLVPVLPTPVLEVTTPSSLGNVFTSV